MEPQPPRQLRAAHLCRVLAEREEQRRSPVHRADRRAVGSSRSRPKRPGVVAGAARGGNGRQNGCRRDVAGGTRPDRRGARERDAPCRPGPRGHLEGHLSCPRDVRAPRGPHGTSRRRSRRRDPRGHPAHALRRRTTARGCRARASPRGSARRWRRSPGAMASPRLDPRWAGVERAGHGARSTHVRLRGRATGAVPSSGTGGARDRAMAAAPGVNDPRAGDGLRRANHAACLAGSCDLGAYRAARRLKDRGADRGRRRGDPGWRRRRRAGALLARLVSAGAGRAAGAGLAAGSRRQPRRARGSAGG